MNYEELVSSHDVRSIFIAEAGINHDGNLEKAKRMVHAAAVAGADYVKFQTFKAEKLATPDALTSSYIDKGSHAGESFRALLLRLEVDREGHRILKECCDEHNIKFFSTAFDESSFDLLQELGQDMVKIASGNLTNIKFLRHMATAGLPMIVSTGMATLGEIEDAVEVITQEGNYRIVLLHCISWYPADIEDTNLCYMETLRHAFGFPVGYSDHTLGINMSIAARALGAVVLEKHFTLDATQFGPDHGASVEPGTLKDLICGLREVEAGLGTTVRRFGKKELGQRKVHRLSIVVNRLIKKGETFTEESLTIKRPGTGIEPKQLDDIIGKKASKDLRPEILLSYSDIVF